MLKSQNPFNKQKLRVNLLQASLLDWPFSWKEVAAVPDSLCCYSKPWPAPPPPETQEHPHSVSVLWETPTRSKMNPVVKVPLGNPSGTLSGALSLFAHLFLYLCLQPSPPGSPILFPDTALTGADCSKRNGAAGLLSSNAEWVFIYKLWVLNEKEVKNPGQSPS